MTTHAVLVDELSNRFSKIMIHDDEVLEVEGRLTIALLEKWGPVLAETDGEDSSGRSKLRALSPEEIVDKAISISEISINKLRLKGWLKPGISLEEFKRDNKSY